MSEKELKADALGRDGYARSLYDIIKEYLQDVKKPVRPTDNDAFVVAISAPWGSGKSYFVQYFQEVLEGKQKDITGIDPSLMMDKKVNVIRYNAWEKDFWDNGLEPLYDAICTSDFNKKALEEGKTGEFLQKSMISVLRKTMKGVWGFAMMHPMVKVLPTEFREGIGSLPDAFVDAMKNGFNGKDLIEERFPEYADFAKAVDELKKALKEGIDNNGKLVIIIDELDRCKPTFAVQTLEMVKHLFNVEGIVFIFALDIIQLRRTVENVYGKDFDAVGYLERFFDYTTLMPQGNMKDFFLRTLKEFGVNDKDAETVEIYYQIARKFNLSAREIRAVCLAYHYVEEYELDKYKYPSHAKQMYFYLLVLKYKEPVKVMEAFSDSKQAEATRKTLMGSYPPVFSGKQNSQEFEMAFTDNKVISEYDQFWPIDKNGVAGNITTSFYPESIPEEDSSYSYALYHADYRDEKWYEKIKDFKLLEYLFRKVELYDRQR